MDGKDQSRAEGEAQGTNASRSPEIGAGRESHGALRRQRHACRQLRITQDKVHSVSRGSQVQLRLHAAETFFSRHPALAERQIHRRARQAGAGHGGCDQ